jgi:HAD superfamily hydrolase (TIGR01509 family)
LDGATLRMRRRPVFGSGWQRYKTVLTIKDTWMIHAILFDAGDILYSKPSRQQAFDAFLLSRGYAASKNPDPIAKEMRLKAHAGQMSELEFFERLMAHHGVNHPTDVEDGIKLLHAEQRKVVFFDGVADTLFELKRQGFKLGIVTNTYNSQQEKYKWFAPLGIDKVWDTYANSCDLKIIKPDPAIYMAALDPIGVHPQNAAFVGHAKKELDGAKALDITTIRFNPDPDCVEADFTANSFRDILDLSCIVESANTMSANKPSI